MSVSIDIRPETTADAAAIAEVNRVAFESDDEANLVSALRESDAFIPELSLVALDGGSVVGHLMMTYALIRGASETTPVLALGPMAVIPSRQRQGIGSMLAREGLSKAKELGQRVVVVLGHPEFYPRFGFERASRYGVRSPFDAPDDAFMIAFLAERREWIDGVVEYAEPFLAL